MTVTMHADPRMVIAGEPAPPVGEFPTRPLTQRSASRRAWPSPICNAIAVAALAGALCACQAQPRPQASMSAPGKSAALRTMEQVAIAAHRCWFASKDPAFRSYRMANELNSFSGRPRILLVPARNPESRPLLVVQAEGAPARVDAFGPLMAEPVGARIGADVRRWMNGDPGCGVGA